MYGNAFYTQFFNGFATGFTLDYTPVRGYTFNDDLTGKNAQIKFRKQYPGIERFYFGDSGSMVEYLYGWSGPGILPGCAKPM
jgi:hypothetical protein